mgnify:CR=1 FL=1
MIQLTLVGKSPDGKDLLFEDEGGVEYSVEVTDELVAQMFDTPQLEVKEDEKREPLSPREIQTLLRDGLSANQIASQTGTPLERVRRYERPVLAEINHAILEATQTRVGVEVDAPTMGDLVVDRLANMEVDVDALRWSAHRNRRGRWEAVVHYQLDGEPTNARWELSPSGLVARNKSAKKLTEMKRREEPEPVRSFFPLSQKPRAAQASAPAPEERRSTPPAPPATQSEAREPEVLSDAQRQEALVEEANSRRGRVVPLMEEIEGEAETFPLEPRTRVTVEETESVVPGLLPAEKDVSDEERPALAETSEPKRRSSGKKKGRRSIPSWDEIVFGSRQD